MKAMVLRQLCQLADNRRPLEAVELPEPDPGEGEVLVRVTACAVYYTERDDTEAWTPV